MKMSVGVLDHYNVTTRKQYDQWKNDALQRWGPRRIKPALTHWPR